jgi:RNA polymerase sigma-70 factor (ECF subfamily)
MTNSRDAAEDITQDVFLELLRQPGRLDATRGQMRSFLVGIARNLVLKAFRRDKNRWSALDEEQFVAQPVDIAGYEIADVISNSIQDLPPLQREVLVLAHYEGLSLEEIARGVAAELGTVKSRLHRARENLKRMLAPLKGVVGSSRPHGTLSDYELEYLLNSWMAQNAPQSLEEKLFARRRSWWQWLFNRHLLGNHSRRRKRLRKV